MTPLRSSSATWLLWLCAAAALPGCGARECALDDPKSCADGQVCEPVQGRPKPLCFAPVMLSGRVFDVSTNAGVAAAQVLAVDENGAPTGAGATSTADGTYAMRVASTRADEKGAVVGRKVMLRSQAKNYVPFPSLGRVSLPIDTGLAAALDGGAGWQVKTPLTDVGLNPLAGADRGRPSVSGTVATSDTVKAVLLVLEGVGAPGRSALAAPDGSFTFFNVPAGSWQVSAYAQGINYEPATVAVGSTDVTGVRVTQKNTQTATLSGSVQLVAGANGAGTSVVLVVESTFVEALGRGEVPPGLRAPAPGVAPNVTGSWSISGIPDGKYVVLAAFENDDNVRDPDPNISGTQVQHLTVTNGSVGSASPSFKVTAAVDVVSPGRDAVETVGGAPTFTWRVFSNADAYLVRVFDGLGVQAWSANVGDKATVTLPYTGPALTQGQYYQWRVTALRRGAPTSQSEELRGLFRVQ